VNASAAQKVYEQRLNTIITVMSHTDGIGCNIVGKVAEVALAKIACRHLNALTM
jgi:hypothetical protein